jgi:excisionase family DNA binding protein
MDSLRKEDVLLVRDVAELMRCSTRTVVRCVDRGEIPAVRFGGRLLFVRDQVEAAIRGLSTPSGEPA